MNNFFSSFSPQYNLSIYRTLFENAHEGILITDEKGIIRAVNPAFTLITDYTAEEAISNKPSFLKSGRHDKRFYASMWKKLRKIGRWNGNVWNRRKNGEIFLIDLTITSVKSVKEKNTL